MRILHIINTLNIAGAERLMTAMIPVQKSCGHQVELLILNDTMTTFYKSLQEKGIKIHAFHMKGGEYSPMAVLKLRKYMSLYDIVHVHLFPSQYWVAICKWLFRLRIPIVTTEHSTSNRRFNHLLTTWTDRWVYRRYSCVIGITDAVTRVMGERLKCRVPVLTIQNGVDTGEYRTAWPVDRRELGLPENCRMVLQVARFRHPKNQECLIRSVALLPQDVHVVFAGDGENMELCKRLARQLHVADRVHFLGIRDDIPRLYAASDVGVVSSHWEGFGLAAVEGMAAGKPVVVSRVEGLAQVVGRDDLCFEDDDEKQLAALIGRLLDENDFYREAASYCQQRAQLFSIERMADEHLALYEKCIAGDTI